MAASRATNLSCFRRSDIGDRRLNEDKIHYELLSQSKDLRVENNVTQTEMAEMLKIGQDKISNYEKGKISPRLDVYLKYLDYLGYSLQIVKKDDKAD